MSTKTIFSFIRFNKKISILVAVLLILVGLIAAGVNSFSTTAPLVIPKIEGSDTPTSSPAISEIKGTEATVARVIDGDTVELSTGEKVRYIGVDTPETVDPRRPVQCLGKEASTKNKELVEGKKVNLEKDVSETDKYGRLLRYVYVDDQMINEVLVREGFAKASSYPPDVKYQDKFREAEQSARSNKWGLWSDTCTGTSPAITQSPASSPAPTKNNASPLPTTKTSTPPASCSNDTYNCSDFKTCTEVKTIFNACTNDSNKLDSDNDGIPCEFLCQN